MKRNLISICFAILTAFAFTSCTNLLVEAAKADKTFLEADKAELVIGFAGSDSASSVTGNLTLPGKNSAGTTVSWVSNNTNAISNSGVVTRSASDTGVILTATLKSGNASDTKLFGLTVKAKKAIAFTGLTANGSPSANPLAIVTTSSLQLTFDSDPSTLNASYITVTGATIGSLSGTGLTRSLGISAITVADGADVSVSIADQSSATFTPAQRSVAVNVGSTSPTAVAFTALTQVDGISGSVTTTKLNLSFDVNPATLALSDITVTGATKGTLTGTGLSRTLTITGIPANGDTITVGVASPSGFSISGSSKTVVVYKAATLILSAGVTGFVAPVTGASKQLVGALGAGAATYTVTGLSWNPTTSPYVQGTVYTASVVLTSEAGFKFPAAGIALPTATAGGGTVSAGTTSGGDISGNVLTFTVTFPSTISDASLVAADKTALAVIYVGADSASSVTQNVTLPISGSNGSTISWTETSDTGNSIAITGTSGAITRPAFPTTTNAAVTLRATITKGAASDTKDFTFTVLAPAGTEADPYLIYTASHFSVMRDNINGAVAGANVKVYKLMADISLSAYATGTGWVPIGNTTTKFSGTLHGNGKTIRNLFINDTSTYYKGLFGILKSGTIDNLVVETIDVTGSVYVGGLIGCCWDGLPNSSITNCSVSGSVTASSDLVGGLVGSSTNNSISNCSSTVSVKQTGTYPYAAGGLVGNNSTNSTISNSYATGSVQGGYWAGGLVGRMEAGSLTDCYATGSVTGSTLQGVGALVGSVYSSSSVTLTNCYATGAVIASNPKKGGLLGLVEGTGTTTVTNCFYNADTTGMTTLNESHGTAKTTAEMKLQSTFTGWDFTNVWKSRGGFIYLRSFPEPIIVTFDTGGGGEVASQIVTSGSLVSQPAEPTPPPNYTFVCWCKTNSMSDAWYFDTDTVSTNTTIYVYWEVVSVK